MGALSFLQGLSEPWAPVLKVLYNGVVMGLQGFRIRGPYQGTMAATLRPKVWMNCTTGCPGLSLKMEMEKKADASEGTLNCSIAHSESYEAELQIERS